MGGEGGGAALLFAPFISEMVKVFQVPAEPQPNPQSFNISLRSWLCGCHDNLLTSLLVTLL